MQVSNESFSNRTSDPHLETIVVEGLRMRMYQDGELKGNATLPGLVTDCTGYTLELGREGMSLGELVFYSRALTDAEIRRDSRLRASTARSQNPLRPEQGSVRVWQALVRDRHRQRAVSCERSGFGRFDR